MLTWEEKTEMIRSANKCEYEKFFDFADKNIEKFNDDEQAQDMFFTAAPLDLETLASIEFKKLQRIKNHSEKWTFSSMRTAIRSAYFDQLISDYETISNRQQ